MKMKERVKAYLILKRVIGLFSERNQTVSLAGGVEVVSTGLFAGCSAVPIRGRKVVVSVGSETVLEGEVWDSAYADSLPSIKIFKDGNWTRTIRLKNVLA